MAIKVLHVVPYIGDESSGPAYSVPNLCRSLVGSGIDISLHTLNPIPQGRSEYEIIGYNKQKFPHPALGRSPQMLKALKEICTRSDIIHNHSLWMLPNIYPEYAKRGTACKLVVSPRGTLSDWARRRSKGKKLISWFMGQRKALLNADMLHATSMKEYKEIRNFGLKQPVAIIPNGIDVPELQPVPEKNKPRQLLFLGRIHPVKGLENLINAWGKLERSFGDWELVIAGPGKKNYVEKLRQLVIRLNLKRVIFKGELKGIEKQNALLGAELFVLPSYTENFGMVVAEALSNGLPVITTNETPWFGLSAHKCGWCVEVGITPLAQAIYEALSKSIEHLISMGDRGRLWMKDDFSWNSIGIKTALSYRWLLYRENIPSWIYTN